MHIFIYIYIYTYILNILICIFIYILTNQINSLRGLTTSKCSKRNENFLVRILLFFKTYIMRNIFLPAGAKKLQMYTESLILFELKANGPTVAP